jgi:U3 small nucleolar RNA-associated protein 3
LRSRALAGGGDDDLPYRARERKAPRARGADLDGAEPAPRGAKRAREEDGGGEGPEAEEDGYYALVQKEAHARKAAKKAEYDAERAATRYVVLSSRPTPLLTHTRSADIAGADAAGPRAASRAILANKGLTPRRAKAVRNPRVKKRLRFEAAKKRVASQRPVFKAGVDAARYGGERSGISKVVKSTRL